MESKSQTLFIVKLTQKTVECANGIEILSDRTQCGSVGGERIESFTNRCQQLVTSFIQFVLDGVPLGIRACVRFDPFAEIHHFHQKVGVLAFFFRCGGAAETTQKVFRPSKRVPQRDVGLIQSSGLGCFGRIVGVEIRVNQTRPRKVFPFEKRPVQGKTPWQTKALIMIHRGTHIENELPQPHLVFALGLSTLKPRLLRSL